MRRIETNARRVIAITCGLTIAGTISAGELTTFTEVSAEVGVAVQHDPSDTFSISQYDIAPMTAGGAVGDFNRDGYQDLYVVVSGAATDRLFINNGDGTFSDQTAAWGVEYAHMGLGAAVGDFDDDGWLDIFISSVGPGSGFPLTGQHILYRNTGNGSFENVAAAAGVQQISPTVPDGFGSAFGDFDLDGDLDLFTASWVYQSNGNRLFRNNDDGTFTDVTVSAGVLDLSVRGFSPVFADMNGDRFPELLIAADFGTSRYFINNTDGTFTEFTGPSGTGLDGNGMGQTVNDFNNDGLPDWYVTSIYTPESQLIGVPGTGNMLYLNDGDHTYDEVSQAAQVKDGGWGWGTVGTDINHDGLVDLVETNGWAQTNWGFPEWQNEQCYVWLNQGNGTFLEIAESCGFEHTFYGRGLVRLDLENDGDMDFAVFSYNGPLKIFRNNLVTENGHALRLFFDTDANDRLAPDGFGTHVVAVTGGQEHHGWMNGTCQYLSQSELSVHLGLGDAPVVDELRIEWSSGVVTVLEDVPADQTMTITAGIPEDLNGDLTIDVQDLVALIFAWGQSGGAGDVNNDGEVNVEDLVRVLFAWE